MASKDEHKSSATVRNPAVVNHVEPDHSPPPEGIVLNVPAAVWFSVGLIASVIVILVVIAQSYYNVAH